MSSDKNAKVDPECEVNQIVTLNQFCEVFPWPTYKGMRRYIQHADQYGLGDAFMRVGRRVLVCPKLFFKLIKQVGKK